jgi:hypothetical protein
MYLDKKNYLKKKPIIFSSVVVILFIRNINQWIMILIYSRASININDLFIWFYRTRSVAREEKNFNNFITLPTDKWLENSYEVNTSFVVTDKDCQRLSLWSEVGLNGLLIFITFILHLICCLLVIYKMFHDFYIESKECSNCQ